MYKLTSSSYYPACVPKNSPYLVYNDAFCDLDIIGKDEKEASKIEHNKRKFNVGDKVRVTLNPRLRQGKTGIGTELIRKGGQQDYHFQMEKLSVLGKTLRENIKMLKYVAEFMSDEGFN
uniref:DNA-directed RNA polymerase n=1 Tax=Rhabditophanes sp. KR3021 TaxID=114890 RepID=A0AC35UED5_9BILA